MGAAALAAVSLAAALAAPAEATTTTIDFDPDQGYVAGQVLGAVGGATFVGSPKVFAPIHVTTQSPPNALHPQSACGATPSSCAMEVTFASPKSAVNLRLGLDDEPSNEFAVPYQLTGYDSGDTPVAQSNGSFLLGAPGYDPITTKVVVQSLSTNIAKVVLQLGASSVYSYNTAYARRPAIDDFTFTDNALPPPAAPSVKISSPASGQKFLQPSEVRVSGKVTAPSGVSRFCLTTSTAPTIPANCPQADSLQPAGEFSDLIVPGVVPGTNTITAWVEDGALRTASYSVPIDVAQVDLSATNLEVTQAIQNQIPSVSAPPGGARTATYNGVGLAAGHATVARFWTGVDLGTGAGTLSSVHALLYGWRGGVSLGDPISPIEGASNLGTASSVPTPGPTLVQRSEGTSQAFTFRLPASWTSGNVTLEAVVNPASLRTVTECAGCEADNGITLGGIAFTPERRETISPIEMFTRDDHGNIKRPFPNWSGVYTVMPFPVGVGTYRGQIDISDGDSVTNREKRQDMAMGKLLDWVDHNGTPPGHLIAMSEGQDLGLTMTTIVCCHTHLGIDTVAQVESTRPLTSVAHEFGHEVGLAHAGTEGPLPGNPKQDRACGGGSEGQQGTDWPPDQRGLVAGVGVDPRTGSGGSAATLRVLGLVDGSGNPLDVFDFMSYCASDGAGNAWVSVRNWTRLLGDHAAGAAGASRIATASGAAPSARAPRGLGVVHGKLGKVPNHGPALRVTAVIVPGGQTRILGIEPETGATIKPNGKSSVTVRVEDAKGHVVSSTPVPVTEGHMDEIANFTLVNAVVRARNAARLQLLDHGRVVAKGARSRHTPRVRLVKPRRRARIPGTGSTPVRWKARDPDGGRLTASIDFSPNGRVWRTLVTGLRGKSYALPNELLTHSGHARIRVRVSDGWNEGRAVSGPLRVTGPAARALIDEPLPGARIGADSTFTASGLAFDDRGRPVPTSAMRWYDGRRYLGSGRRLTVRGMTPGHRRLRLVTSAHGRRAVFSVPLRIGP